VTGHVTGHVTGRVRVRQDELGRLLLEAYGRDHHVTGHVTPA
jgi:hypothetical protein